MQDYIYLYMTSDDRNNCTMTRSRTGSKRQLPSGRWEVRVSRGYRVDGRQRTIHETVDTEAEADRRIAELSAQMGKEPDVGAGITLERLWSLYLADKGTRLSKKTLVDYTHYMDAVWLPAMGDEDISTITRRQIQGELLRCGTRHKAASARTALSSTLTYAANRGWLSHHPMKGTPFEMPGDTGSAWDDEDVWDDDPFAAIEGGRDVWGVDTVLACMPLIRGLPLEPVWLAMVGGGLRMEEAFALRGMDVRRVDVGGHMTTQVAVHHARTDLEDRKRTKTRQSVRIAAIVDPFGERYFELASAVGRDELVCKADPSNQNKRWRSYFDPPRIYHKRMAESRKVAGRLYSLPYIPLSRMRATHATIMQEAGVIDSLNAAAHGHSVEVARAHYLRGDMADAVEQTRRYLGRS